MPDHIHVQRVTRDHLLRVASGQPWAFPLEVEPGVRVVGVRIEVAGLEQRQQREPAQEPEEDEER